MLLTAVTFFIILSLLIFVHELGHYLVARFIGVGVEEFGFGLPPRMWGKKVKGTIYSINWLPIGGFVKLAGEDEDPTSLKASRGKEYFFNRSKKERGAILIAGVAMNFLLATAILSYLVAVGLTVPAKVAKIISAAQDSPAQKSGFQPEDLLISASYTGKDGSHQISQIKYTRDLQFVTKTHLGQPITISVLRNGHEKTISVTPRTSWPKGQGPVGLSMQDITKEIKVPWQNAPWIGLQLTLERVSDTLTGFGDLVSKLVQGEPVGDEVAGPIGIAQVTGQAVRFGFKVVLEFVSILSLNLAVINILPFPALDGGRLAFVFLEKILGRKVRPAFERSTHQIGMIILFALILLVSIHDILRFARGGGLTP